MNIAIKMIDESIIIKTFFYGEQNKSAVMLISKVCNCVTGQTANLDTENDTDILSQA